MSVESGLSAPVDRSVAEPPNAPPSRAGRAERRGAPGLRRSARGPARADALADAVSTPSFPTRGRGRPRRKGRRVKRVVRRIELWSVLKISLVFNTVMLGVALGSVAILWGLANTTGLVEDLEGFLRDSGFEDFRFRGDEMFEKVAFIGAVLTLAFTVFTVLATALLNLISEITGGIRFVVIEEILDDPAPAAPTTAPREEPRPAAPPVAAAPASPPPPPAFVPPPPRRRAAPVDEEVLREARAAREQWPPPPETGPHDR